MHIDRITPTDLAGCAVVFVEVFNHPPWQEHWTPVTALARLEEIAHTPGFVGFKAQAQSQITGFIMGYCESFDAGSDFYLKEMCVLPDRQRQGIGAALLDTLKRDLCAKGVRKLYLLTMRDSPAADFYAKQGCYTSDKMILMGQWLE